MPHYVVYMNQYGALEAVEHSLPTANAYAQISRMVGERINQERSEEWLILAAKNPTQAIRIARLAGFGLEARKLEGVRALEGVPQTEGLPGHQGMRGCEGVTSAPRRIIRRGSTLKLIR